MTTIGMLKKILRDIDNIEDVEESAIASREGLLIFSTISKKQHAEAFVAMSAAMMGAAETATTELGKDIPDRIIVNSRNGKIIATGAGPKALLLVMTKPNAGLELVMQEMTKASEMIKEILGDVRGIK